jgi:hypothetical protein
VVGQPPSIRRSTQAGLPLGWVTFGSIGDAGRWRALPARPVAVENHCEQAENDADARLREDIYPSRKVH